MDLYEKIRTLPTQPGVYLYKNAEGEVIYVGKANNLRSRVRSYLLEASQANAKTGSLMREAVDIETILVANADGRIDRLLSRLQVRNTVRSSGRYVCESCGVCNEYCAGEISAYIGSQPHDWNHWMATGPRSLANPGTFL